MTSAAGEVDGRAAGPAYQPDDPNDAAVWAAAATVVDPEIPVLTIADLGILRSARLTPEGPVVELTPTYSGCPAMGLLRDEVSAALVSAGYAGPRVTLVLSPAWTTDWMTEEGKAKLRDYGIAPPSGTAAEATEVRGRRTVSVQLSVPCPRCGSLDTRETTRFGSTACKAMYTCQACLEPFDYFKVL